MTRTFKWIFSVGVASALVGCGGGGYGGSSGGSYDPGTGSPPPAPVPAMYSIGGTVSGLSGSVVLRNNGQDDLTVNANGAFTFATALDDARPYLVTVQTQPATQECTVDRGMGMLAGGNVINVAVTCTDLPAPRVEVVADVGRAILKWRAPAAATSFDVYVSSIPNCDIQDFASCPDGARLENVSSPLTVDDLRNGQPYYFRVDAKLSGVHLVSNAIGARPNTLAFDRDVQAIVVADDGTAYLGGLFSRVGPATGGGVSLSVASGRPSRADFPIVVGAVHAVAADGSGGWYIGGSFTSVGNQPRNGLAHILSDGTVDPDFHPLVQGQVTLLSVAGSTIYVGGTFSSIGPAARSHLAAIGADGMVLSWNPGANGSVNALLADGDVIYVGGNFTSVGPANAPVPRNHLAAFGADGSVLSWDPNVTGQEVSAMAKSGDTLFIGGTFNMLGGTTSRANAAAVSTLTGEVLPWNPNVNESVEAMALAGGRVYLGGSFDVVGGEARPFVAAVDVSGAGRVLDWAPSVDGLVNAVAVVDGTVYIGGGFGSVNDVEHWGLAAIDANGSMVDWGPSPNNSVDVLGVSGDEIYAGGAFNAVDAVPRSHLAAVDARGRLLDWNPVANGSVFAMIKSGDTIYAGGGFTQIADSTRNHLAAIRTNGDLASWAPSADDDVFALARDGDVIYAGGRFGSFTTPQGGVTRNGLAAIGADGGVLSWNPRANSTVVAIQVSNGKVFVGGSFSSVTTDAGTFPRVGVAAITTDGAVVDAFHPDISAGGAVSALAVSGDTVFVGGSFTSIGNKVRANLAAVGTDGSVSDAFPQTEPAGNVRAFAISDNTLYVGGRFAGIRPPQQNGLARNNVAALDLTGQPLNWNPNAFGGVNTIAISNGVAYLGGIFQALGSATSFGYGTVSATGP